MESWLKGGLWGASIGFIILLGLNLVPWIIGVIINSNDIISLVCFHCIYKISNLITYIAGGFIIGFIIGWIINKIKSQNNK